MKGPDTAPDAVFRPLHNRVVGPPTTNHAPPIPRNLGPESSAPEESPNSNVLEECPPGQPLLTFRDAPEAKLVAGVTRFG
ncbi:hypothetical protein GCM10009854_50200 [Saccharopolyspora halophila]|uniref:Uncharacterized protein n=1 Tax=Saccharopolyspora halophila TaxID=405551 RepID=A0ABN3GYQ8_9PSEU